MANISIPVGNRVEFSRKTICFVWFNQPKRNAHTNEKDKNKKGRKTNIVKQLCKKRTMKWLRSGRKTRVCAVCVQSLCLSPCMRIGPYCTFDWMKSNDQIDVTLIAFVINDRTFSLVHPLPAYRLPKSKQKKPMRFENLHQNFEHRLNRIASNGIT